MSASRTLFNRLSTTARPTIASRFATTPITTSTASRAFHASSPNMTVHEIKTYEEFASIRKVNKVVLVDFHAVWCGPCKIISPIFEKRVFPLSPLSLQLSEDPKFAHIYFAKIDVDAVPQVAQEQGIRAMPTFLAFVDDKKTGEIVGANPPALQKLVTDAASA
ncbi:thioredoxin 1 [Sporothrix schenckii 1099-18]|uniref:Thioredoxin 1 n=1 Tax=Sporothrix schenckii 1099-18 TaxID=1397361 RepID=A0A0F2LRM0_SPOSC|nr:thioredoxin 1 [Sporothrix schenckii 1099-18]KJR80183.1 thioredoxin 1 [Sporothrix schenckii 1099-18]